MLVSHKPSISAYIKLARLKEQTHSIFRIIIYDAFTRVGKTWPARKGSDFKRSVYPRLLVPDAICMHLII